jgi:hypothetical protein
METDRNSTRASFRRPRGWRPSPAMAVALLALVIAMSGTAIATTQLSKNSVGSRNIKPGAVTHSDLRNGAVRGSKLGDSGITDDKLAKGAVTAQALGDGVVGRAKLAGGAVSSDKLALGAVLAGNLGKESVLSGKIGKGAVNGESVADGSLDTEDFSGAIPAVRVTATQNQDVSNGGPGVDLAFDSEIFDTRNMHTDSGPDNTKIFAPVDGVYVITGNVVWSSKGNAQGFLAINIDKNGDEEGAFSLAGDAGATDTYEANIEVPTQNVSTIAWLRAGDYVELRAIQTLTQFPAETHPTIRTEAIPAESVPELSMVWVAPGPS